MSSDNGYSAIMVQSEVTDDGPFDLKEMQGRQASALRGLDKNTTYPNVTPMNLGIIAGEIVLTRKVQRSHRRSGGQKLAVFSSFNGYWWGRYKTKAGNMRNLQFAGIAKNMYQMPGAEMTGTARGADYQTDSGVSWLSSGAMSANCNTGPQVILAGDLVYLDMPDFTPIVNQLGNAFPTPNNAVAGAPNGKYVIATKPVSAMTFGGQLEYYFSLMKTTKSSTPGGILDIPFHELYEKHPARPNEKLLDDGQNAAAALWYALWGIYEALSEGVAAAGGAPGVNYRSVRGADRVSALTAIERLFVNHMSNPARRTDVHAQLRQTYGNAYGNDGKLLNGTKGNVHSTAVHMQVDALDLLFSAIGDAMHEQNRWVIGRALHTSHPGKTLDIEIGSFTRPYTH
jgi:hypothetical protein